MTGTTQTSNTMGTLPPSTTSTAATSATTDVPGASSDTQYPTTTLTKLAFGSCHYNRANTLKADFQPIWPSITENNPQSFLWLGDAIYAPKKKKRHTIAPLEVLEREYSILLTNSTIGYSDFLLSSSSSSLMSVHGTHDDHDYGANDYGKHMPDKKQRTALFSKFVRHSNEEIRTQLIGTRKDEIDYDHVNNEYDNRMITRSGLYTSIEYGTFPNKVKVILLDTRYSRDDHCPIPSIGAWKLPFKLASPLACITRWITAGLNLQQNRFFRSKCERAKVLSEEQWSWLEEQLDLEPGGGREKVQDEEKMAAVYIIGSSVQVLTTNPTIESWGHYPHERLRLLKLLNNVGKRRKNSNRKTKNSNNSADEDVGCGQGPAVVLLSGDVHHGEILDSSVGLKQNGNWNDGDGRIIEVTSSGLTHSCIGPFYGPLCAPILETFPNHRHGSIKNYYTGRNFGSIEIQWNGVNENAREGGNITAHDAMEISVHNTHGEKVLSTGLHPLCTFGSQMTEEQLEDIVGVADGHLIPYLSKCVSTVLLMFLLFLLHRRVRRYRYKSVLQVRASCENTKKMV